MKLQTARFMLRDFVPDDFAAFVALETELNAVADDVVDDRQHLAHFGRVLALAEQQPRRWFQLAIIERTTATLVGSCRLNVRNPDQRRGEISYAIDPRCRNRGYASEAAAALLQYGFTILNLHRITAACFAQNVASVRVLEKLGLRREAHYRESTRHNGAWHDTYLYAILSHELPPASP